MSVAQKTQFYQWRRERQNYQPRDPWVGLAAAVVIRAIQDLQFGDPITRLDAWSFLDDSAPIWLDGLDFDVSREKIMSCAA